MNISKVQDDEVGDGTTSVCVLAAELLREAEQLVAKKIHPQIIVEGFRIAEHAALTALSNSAVDHGFVLCSRTNNLTKDKIPKLSGRIWKISPELR